MDSAQREKGLELAVDDHFIQEGKRMESVRGALVLTPPAEEPHARRHAELGYVLRSHVADGYLVALDMLTRTSERSNFAPDASIYPARRESDTGGRQLEVMAFEIVSRQRRSVATEKAAELSERGVAHIFCIDLNTEELLEWGDEGWHSREPASDIEAACLCLPLPVEVLLNATASDDAVAAALLRRGNSVLEQRLLETAREAHADGVETGLERGHHEALLLLAARQLGRDLTEAERLGLLLRLRAEDPSTVLTSLLEIPTPQALEHWLVSA